MCLKIIGALALKQYIIMNHANQGLKCAVRHYILVVDKQIETDLACRRYATKTIEVAYLRHANKF